MRKTIIIGIIVLAGLGWLSISAEAKMVLKAGHVSPKTSLEGMGADKFAELVAQKTNGEIVVEMFPSEQLGKAVAMIDSTVMGNQDIYIGGNVEFERFSKGARVVGLNYAVVTQEHFRKVLASPIWQEIFDEPLAKVGLKVLASNWERGPYRYFVSTKPIKNWDDMKGIRLRIAPLDTWRRSWTALGCNVVVLPWTDVYLGLRQNLVDAGTVPSDVCYAMKWTEIAKHVIQTDEYWGLLTVQMHKNKFDSLKPEWQKALLDAANEAGKYHKMLSDKANVDDLEKMKKEHGITFTVIDKAPAVAKMLPLIREFEKEGFIPAGLYDRIQALK
jgi:tripartite ATP-independent transporter DctP family solute receptor